MEAGDRIIELLEGIRETQKQQLALSERIAADAKEWQDTMLKERQELMGMASKSTSVARGSYLIQRVALVLVIVAIILLVVLRLSPETLLPSRGDTGYSESDAYRAYVERLADSMLDTPECKPFRERVFEAGSLPGLRSSQKALGQARADALEADCVRRP